MGYTSKVFTKFVDSASKMNTDELLVETATTSPKGRIWSGRKCSIFRNLEPYDNNICVSMEGLGIFLWMGYVCARMHRRRNFS